MRMDGNGPGRRGGDEEKKMKEREVRIRRPSRDTGWGMGLLRDWIKKIGYQKGWRWYREGACFNAGQRRSALGSPQADGNLIGGPGGCPVWGDLRVQHSKGGKRLGAGLLQQGSRPSQAQGRGWGHARGSAGGWGWAAGTG